MAAHMFMAMCQNRLMKMRLCNYAPEPSKKTIERDLPSLLIEIHPFSLQRNFASSGEAVRDYFLNLGYRMWQLNDDNSHMFESTQIDPKRRWKDYFLIHPSRGPSLPDGMFRKAFTN